MKLKEIRLKNFRCYEDLTVPLHENLTVLVAPNGQGKTAILDAIIYLISPYVNKLNLYDETELHIDESSIRLIPDIRQKETSYIPMVPQLPCVLYVENNKGRKWHLALESFDREKNEDRRNGNVKKNDKVEVLLNLAQNIINQNQSMIEPIEDLPLFLFYSVNRGLGEKPSFVSRSRNRIENTRFFAYNRCLSEFSNYSDAFNWFVNLYDQLKAEAFERIELGETISWETLHSDFTTAIREVVDIVLSNTGWGKIQTKTITHSRTSQIILTHAQIGTLEEWQLSEGIRSILGMVMDIAYRCCILNSHLGKNAIKETEGFVLIDEVDMHLHPEWQQVILRDLQLAFPKLQFIVTTHSPQVLSTVKKENIRVIRDGKLEEVQSNTYGELSSDVMYRVQGVNPRPPIDERVDLEKLTILVDGGHYEKDEAKSLLNKLIKKLGEHNEAIIRINRSIERQKKIAALKEKNNP